MITKFVIPEWPAPANVFARAMTEVPAISPEIAMVKQVHGNNIVEASSEIVEADGLYTRDVNITCCIKTADCLPVLLCDKHGTVVMALHAGWQGLAKDIIGKGIKLILDSGICASDILVWIGPSICQDHYEVDSAFRERFLDLSGEYEIAFAPGKAPEKWQADLVKIAKMQCANAGVTEVYSSNICTYHDARGFPSYRREQNSLRMGTVIGLRDNHANYK